MSRNTHQSRQNAQPADTNDGKQTEIEHVERTDVGVSLTVKLKRGTGTRDQDELIAKAKGSTLEDAREDMDILRDYLHDLATDARHIQPTATPEEEGDDA